MSAFSISRILCDLGLEGNVLLGYGDGEKKTLMVFLEEKNEKER